MAPKTKPQQYAGVFPPDAAFYNRTFESSKISAKDLIRGFCINNAIAREIDDFIEELLRQPSEREMPADDGEDTRVAMYWELDFSKKTHMIFDAQVLRPAVQRFECFQTKWMLDNNIPWVWHNAAIRLWVRTRREVMKSDTRLQCASGGSQRRYPEFSTDAGVTRAKRQKTGHDSTIPSTPTHTYPHLPTPTHTYPHLPTPVRLIDCLLVGVPKRYVEEQRTTKVEDEQERHFTRWSCEDDQSRAQVSTKISEVLKKASTIQHIVNGAEDPRYGDDGDVKPSALQLAKVKTELKWVSVDDTAFWAWADVENDKVVEITSDSGLHGAVEALHKRDVMSGRIELWNVVGRQPT